MSYPSLEKRIALCNTKPEILLACLYHNCVEINEVIRSLRIESACMRKQSTEIAEKINILTDEVRRRAEQMECRIESTTDDDLK